MHSPTPKESAYVLHEILQEKVMLPAFALIAEQQKSLTFQKSTE